MSLEGPEVEGSSRRVGGVKFVYCTSISCQQDLVSILQTALLNVISVWFPQNKLFLVKKARLN